MKQPTGVSGSALGAGIAAVLLAVLLAPLAVAQDAPPAKTRKMDFPDRTDAGRWHGTWAYASRSDKFALWIREGEGGAPEVKLRWESTSNPSTFETDWNTRAEYDTRESQGTFLIEWTERNADSLVGTMTWRVVGDGWSRVRTGPIRIYRAGHGRAAVFAFDNVTETRSKGDREQTFGYPQVWTFLKASKRLVRWEELPL
jgi:hypothetical protein